MSHFVGFVFGSNIEELLAPYDENIEVAEYVKYTQDEAVDEIKQKKIDNYEYALKQEDKDNNWVKRTIEEGPLISYEDAWEEAKNWGYTIDDNNNLLSTYNPNSKWDWYSVGGRWGWWLDLKEFDEDGERLAAVSCTKGEVDWDEVFKRDKIPFCFITEEGEWHERAEMGWWACTANEKEEDIWIKEFKEYLDSVPDDIEITVIDFHI